ncbi:hypothetical protein [Helicobacter ganmani]|uniref:hypothetical protein n=1 Tax=Helicobacter ganmani TaxID=60246 RepID=UPI0011C02A3B|nr:hypothetical protein [Helicobacter ganmani]
MAYLFLPQRKGFLESLNRHCEGNSWCAPAAIAKPRGSGVSLLSLRGANEASNEVIHNLESRLKFTTYFFKIPLSYLLKFNIIDCHETKPCNEAVV